MNRYTTITGGLVIGLVTAFAIGAVALAGGSASAEGKPSQGCSRGFDYHVTTTQAAELPKSQKAIDAGLATKDELIAAYRSGVDHNGNDMVCVKVPPENWKNPLGEYLYNMVDDSSSSANGP